MIDIRRILCPIDFSEYSRHALDHALAVARWYDSSITVLHVFSAAPVAVYAPGVPGYEPIALTSADREQLLVATKRFVESDATADVPVDAVIREGDATSEILNQAQAINADRLVIGPHGRSGFERFMLGSVTEKVLRKATCPVLSVPRRAPGANAAAPVLFKRILCPVDFSDCSMNALNYAMSMAQEADAHLTVLHVMTPDTRDTPDALEEMSRQRLRDVVPNAVGAYCSVDTMTAEGTPYREILRVATEQQNDLIVIGVHGRGMADLMFFGSTTQHLVRQAACPVLTLRKA